MTTIKDALEHGASTLTQAEKLGQSGARIPTRLDAQVLLGYVLNVERAALYANTELLLTAEQE